MAAEMFVATKDTAEGVLETEGIKFPSRLISFLRCFRLAFSPCFSRFLPSLARIVYV
jgi:hypothetical protein